MGPRAARAPRIQNEAIVKLLSGDIVDDDERLLETLLTLRAELDEQQAKLAEGRASLESLPRRKPDLLLVHELGDRLIAAQREWLDEVEKELSG